MEATGCTAGRPGLASRSPLTAEFNDFLFAPVWEDRDEAPLSVISALARLDVDPWDEAAALTRLPTETAAQRLAALLAELPLGPPSRQDCGPISARLVALLPRRDDRGMPSRGIVLHTGPLNGSQIVAAVGIIYLTAFLTAFILMTGHTPGSPTDNAQVVAASAVTAQTAPPNSGQ